MKKTIGIVLACMMLLLTLPAFAWVADETYSSISELPYTVSEALPGEHTFLQALRSGQSIFVLLQVSSDTRRVFIFRQENGDAYSLECVSAPLPEWNGDHATIGCSGSLHLFYEGNVNWIGTFHRESNGIWRLNYIQGEDSFSVYPYGGFFWEEVVSQHSFTRFVFGEVETDLTKVNITTMPTSLSQVLDALNNEGYAMVTNPIPTDRLHLRVAPLRNAASLGKYYTGTPVKVLDSDGEWSKVTVLGVPGYMMTKYLTFGLDMSSVDQAYAPVVIRFEDLDEGIRVYDKPDISSSVTGDIFNDRITLLGTRIYGIVDDDWMHVLSDSGFAGYIEAKHFCEPMN